MKYYLRSIREDGFGECVLPTEKFGRADHWNIESEMEHNNAYEAFMEYLSSLPVSALAHPDLAKKIGWVENYVEGYEGYYTVSAAWTRIYENEYVNKKPEHRRIVLFEKKQEQEMISNRIVLGKDDCYNRLLKALSYLCHLKKWKDEHGKDSHYEQFQPEAWAYAFDVLESMNEKITTPPGFFKFQQNIFSIIKRQLLINCHVVKCGVTKLTPHITWLNDVEGRCFKYFITHNFIFYTLWENC